jgi:hypothetical protein
MGSLKDRMKVSQMAKFPKEFRELFCTSIETLFWDPHDIDQIGTEENNNHESSHQQKEEVLQKNPVGVQQTQEAIPEAKEELEDEKDEEEEKN